MTNIVVSKKNKVTQIIVTNIKSKKDIKEFLDSTKHTTHYVIHFYGVRVLPKEIIIRLHNIKNMLQLNTDEDIFKIYLYKLGFKLNVLEQKKQIQSNKVPIDKIVIGGSAGSLEKFIEIIKNLPKLPITIFLIMHQSTKKPSLLSEVLQTYNKDYNIVQARSDTKVQISTIYTIPSNKHLIVSGNYIFLTDDEKINIARPSISVTFKSISNEYKERLLAILVCGHLNDGSDVLNILKENKTTIIIEDPKECKAKDILKNAINTKKYDYILNINGINNFIKKFTSTKDLSSENTKLFLKNVYDKYGYDFRGYKEDHIKRRLEYSYMRLGSKTFNEFENKVLNNTEVFTDMFLDISINVTTFFRNPDFFSYLREKIIPQLDSFSEIKIWCAGCSSGEEPYSIAILLHELGLLKRSLIYATDINANVLQHAKNGIYTKENYNLFRTHYYNSGGDKSFNNYFDDYGDFVTVSKKIQEKVLFFEHNLITDSSPNEFQIIFCRNVLIYFDKSLKNKVINTFRTSLSHLGYLVFGESEALNNEKELAIVSSEKRIYQKR